MFKGKVLMLHFFKILFLLFFCPSIAFGVIEYKAYSDYEREKNWADQIIPSIIVGDPVWIEQSNEHKFLGIYA